MASNRSFLLAFACLLSCFSFAKADNTTIYTTSIYNETVYNTPIAQILGSPYSNSTSYDPMDLDDCSTKHSGDYYGLGVRVGIYLIWLQSYLANTFLPEEISGALDANTIFLLAIMAAIFRGTFMKGSEALVRIDGLVLMQLCAGYMFGSLSMWGYRTVRYQDEGPAGVNHFGRIGTHSRLALACAISAYGVWFWSIGVLDGHRSLATLNGVLGLHTREECYPLVTFFFAKLDVTGGIRYYYIVTALSCTLYYGMMLLVGTVERSRHFFRMLRARAPIPSVVYETGLTGKELDFLYSFLRVGNLLWMIFSAIMVEMTLNWNKVKQVIGPDGRGQIAYPSQLLPLLIGGLTVVRIIFLIIMQRAWRATAKAGDDRCCEGSELPGQDPDAVLSRPTYVRYLVAWLPWLSQFAIWKRQPSKIEAATYGRPSNGPSIDPVNRDSIIPMMEKSPNTSTFPATPFADSYDSPTTNAPGSPQSPLLTFSPKME